MELIEAILKVISSPGGNAALMSLFADHGVSKEKRDVIMSQLPTPKPPTH